MNKYMFKMFHRVTLRCLYLPATTHEATNFRMFET
jgi:hypothetical protein